MNTRPKTHDIRIMVYNAKCRNTKDILDILNNMKARFEDEDIVDVIMRIYYNIMLGDKNDIELIDYIKFNEFSAYIQAHAILWQRIHSELQEPGFKEYVSDMFNYMVVETIPYLLKYFYRLAYKIEGAVQHYHIQPLYQEDMTVSGLKFDFSSMSYALHSMQNKYQWNHGDTDILIRQSIRESVSLRNIMSAITIAIGQINSKFIDEQAKKEQNRPSKAEREARCKEIQRQRFGEDDD